MVLWGVMVRNHLSLAVMLGLGIASANAGEITFSPSVDSKFSASSTKSGEKESSKKLNDVLLINEFDMDIDYESNILTSNLNVYAFDKRHGKASGDDDAVVTYLWDSTISVLNDNWINNAYYESDYEVINSAKSTFNDLIYQSGDSHNIERYGINTSYSMPSMLSIQGQFNASFTGNNVTFDSKETITRQNQTDFDFNLSQTVSNQGVQWRIAGYSSKKESKVGYQNENRTGDFLIRLPLTSGIKAVATSSYIYQESVNTSLSFVTEDPIEYAHYGVGFAFYDSKKGNLAQITLSKDNRNEDYFFGTDLRWVFDDDHYVTANVTRKFYGDSGLFNYFYSADRVSFDLYYKEDIELEYMIEQEVVNEGLYVCRDGVDSFDESLCWQPESLNYELGQGETIFPKIQVNYPLIDRVVLNKKLGFNWSYDTDYFNSKVQVYKNIMEELDDNYEQESDNVSLLLTQRLNSLSSIDYEFKYRKMTFLPEGRRTYDVLYKATYNHELNSRAKWYVGFQYINKNSDYDIDDFNEVRFSIGYEHHFGKTNNRARDMF
jgi:hypothetical protein